MLMPLIEAHTGPLSVVEACQALGLDPATYQRWKRPPRPAKVRTSPRALTAQERQQVLWELHAPRFVDRTSAHVVATLLDEQTYHCSERTMYRILAAPRALGNQPSIKGGATVNIPDLELQSY